MAKSSRLIEEIEPENWISPWKKINDIYTDGFISSVVERFEIKMDRTVLTQVLREIGRLYLSVNNADFKGGYKVEGQKFRSRGRYIDAVLERFRRWEAEDDMAGLMADAARVTGDPLPQTAFPQLTKHQRQRGDPHFHELLRGLELAKKGMELASQRLSSKGGHPINNPGLEVLTRRAAGFWVETLQRPFTVDHNKGCRSSVSQAFEFVQILAKAIDKIPDEQIITAIRVEKAARKKADLPTRPPRRPAVKTT